MFVNTHSFRAPTKLNGLKWVRNIIINAFWLENNGKASSCKDVTKTYENLATWTSLTTHIISNFVICVHVYNLDLPRKYGIRSVLDIIGARLAIWLEDDWVDGNGGDEGREGDVGGDTRGDQRILNLQCL